LKTGDKIVILIIVLSLVFGFVINRYNQKSETRYLLILSDGQVYLKTPLYDTAPKTTYFVKSSEGYLYVEVNKGKVRVIDSTCKDKLCIKQGEISKVGETIICLPNRISISIVGGNSNVDSISY